MTYKRRRAWWELPVDVLAYCMMACWLTFYGVWAYVELSSFTVALLLVLLLNCVPLIYLAGIMWERGRRRNSSMEGD